MNKITKLATGIGIAASSFYWLTLPALAANEIDLCAPTSGGIKPPGCGGAAFDFGKTIQNILGMLLFVSFIAALIFLIWGGIKWIMSGGDKDGTQKAKDTVTSALIGLAIVLGAWILINIVAQLVTGSSLGNLTVPSLKTN